MHTNPPENTLKPDNSLPKLDIQKEFYGFSTTWNLHFWLNLGVNVRASTQMFERLVQSSHLQNAHYLHNRSLQISGIIGF